MSTSANTTEETHEIERGIYLHVKVMNQQTPEGDPVVLHVFTVETKALVELDFTIDFTGSEDIMVENTEETMIVSTLVKAECAETVAVVKEFPHSRLLWQIYWTKRDPPRDRLVQYQKKAHANLNSQIERSKKIFKQYPLAESKFEEIEQILFENTMKNFVDPEFPPTDDSIFNGQKSDLVVHWRRPVEFMHLNKNQEDHQSIKVFHKEIEPSDIKAGPYSYKWILCALATLAERPHLVDRLFVSKEYKYNGAYRMKINKSGVWQELTIDDYMPCALEGQPLFTRTHGNELWVQLLEKAYAKVHGSYEALKNGHPNEALQDFTGFPTILYDFSDSETESFVKNGDFFKMLVHFQQEGFLLSCNAPGKIEEKVIHPRDRENSLQAGHSYSIVQVREVYSHKLINIRNLWGYFDWDGAWSRKSAFWTPDIKELLNPKLDSDDGTFWMSYDDFIKHFASVNVCKVKQQNEIRLKGKFVRVEDMDSLISQVVSKWFYYLEVQKKTHLLLGLHQIDERIKRVLPRRTYLDTGFLILKKSQEGTQLHEVQDFINSRDTEFETTLEPGQYVILPRTNGIALQRPKNAANNISAPFLQGPNDELTPLFEGAIEDIYYRFDTLITNSIDYNEFKDFYETAVGETITELDFDNKILTNYCSKGKGLTLKGFKEFMREAVTHSPGEEKVREWLNKLGYDKELYSTFSRSFIMTLHSEQPLSIQVGDTVSTNLEDAAQAMILREKASILDNNSECRLLYHPKNSPIDAIMFGCENLTTVPIEVTFNVDKIQNCLRSQQNSIVKKVIQPNRVEFLMHVRRENISGNPLRLDVDFRRRLLE